MDSSNLQLTVFRLGHYMDEAPDLVERIFKEKLQRVVDGGSNTENILTGSIGSTGKSSTKRGPNT
jgi:hypothetical protein